MINRSLLGGLAVHVGTATLAAVLSVVVGGHEDTSSTLVVGALTTETSDLAILVNLVVLEHSKLRLLFLVLVLLGGGVVLLFPLLGTTTKTQYKVKGGLLLDVVIAQGTSILELLASKDQTLLVRRDTFLILDLSFHIFDSI